MLRTWKRRAIAGLCVVCMAPGRPGAQEEREHLRGLEARIMYEATAGLMDQGEYDMALRRFDWITRNHKQSVYAGLARQRRAEIRRMEGVEATLSPQARVGLAAFGTLYGTWVGLGTGILAESAELGFLGMMAGPVAGMGATLRHTRGAPIGKGQASLLALGGAWGTWQGAGAAILATAMAGGNLGLSGMGALAPRAGMSGGRARLINLGGIIGTLYGLGTAVLADRHHQARPTFAMMLAGGILGLGAGTYLTGDRDEQVVRAHLAPGAASLRGPAGQR